MGARLAALLSDALGDDREAALTAATTAAGVEAPVFERLLEAATGDGPSEEELRRLVEAAGADPDDAMAAVREDGMLLEGAEFDGADEQIRQVLPMRLTEAADQTGATPGTKRYEVVVIRPGEANGPGLRIYPQDMLRESAAKFGGQPIFFNHESLDTILKRGHGSRDPRDLAGWLQEATWYDPDYTEPKDKVEGWEPGAVKGHADFLLEAAEYIDKLPKAVRLSIDMLPTKLKAQRRKDKKLGTLVEGVVQGSGSLDLITGRAGAGGRVLQRLQEAAIARYSGAHDVLANALGNEDALGRLVEALAPALADRLGTPAPVPVRRDDVTTIDLDNLSDEDRARLREAVLSDPATQERLVESFAGSEAFDRLVEAKVAEREESIREETGNERDRLLDLRDFRDEAHRLIESAPILMPLAKEDLRERFALRDGRVPTPALDVRDRLTEAGVVEMPAIEVLRASVEEAIKREQDKLREAYPTRARGLSPAAPDPADPAVPGSGDEPVVPDDPLANDLGLDPAEVARHRARGGR